MSTIYGPNPGDAAGLIHTLATFGLVGDDGSLTAEGNRVIAGFAQQGHPDALAIIQIIEAGDANLPSPNANNALS